MFFQSKLKEVTENLSKMLEKCLCRNPFPSKIAGCRPTTLLNLNFITIFLKKLLKFSIICRSLLETSYLQKNPYNYRKKCNDCF